MILELGVTLTIVLISVNNFNMHDVTEILFLIICSVF